VHSADIQDRDGGVLVLSTLFGMRPFLEILFVDDSLTDATSTSINGAKLDCVSALDSARYVDTALTR
jgi:putative transposase